MKIDVGERDTMKRKIGIVIIALGVLCIMGAVFFNSYNEWESDKAGERSDEILDELLKLETDSNEETDGKEETGSLEETSGETSLQKDDSTWEAYLSAPNTVNVKGYNVRGYIEIKSIGLLLPVLEEYNDENLTVAPCVYNESGTGGRLVIAGHNYTRHFASLGSVSVGERVLFTDSDGEKYGFKVLWVGEIEDDDFTAISEGEWDLALFTCNMSGYKRVLVRCALEGQA